jgi:hypothetical protein
MKKVSSLILALAFYLGACAQAPQAFNYQTVVRNASGNIVSNQQVSLRFSVHDGSPSGTVVYKETQTLSTNQFGLISLSVGTGSVVSGVFNAIAWGSGAKYLQVELDATGGSNYISMGTAQLISVPYALYAAKSDTALVAKSIAGGTIPVGSSSRSIKVDTFYSSNSRNAWLSIPSSRITVSSTGTYFVTATFRAKGWTSGDICSGAVQNITSNSKIVVAYIDQAVSVGGNTSASSTVSQIVTLNQGDIIDLEYRQSSATPSTWTWFYGGDNDGWSTLSLFRLY